MFESIKEKLLEHFIINSVNYTLNDKFATFNVLLKTSYTFNKKDYDDLINIIGKCGSLNIISYKNILNKYGSHINIRKIYLEEGIIFIETKDYFDIEEKRKIKNMALPLSVEFYRIVPLLTSLLDDPKLIEFQKSKEKKIIQEREDVKAIKDKSFYQKFINLIMGKKE